MDYAVITELNKALIGIIIALVGWGGVLSLFWLFRNFIIAGITGAFLQVFENGNEKTRQILAQYLVDKNKTLPAIYECLKNMYKE